MSRKIQLKLTCVLIWVLAPAAWPATNDFRALLQKGLFEEEANRDYAAAIQAYQGIASQADEQRKIMATAVFRLGECYRKLGKTNEAAASYQRLLREFPEQGELGGLSRQQLANLGRPAPTAVSVSPIEVSDEESKELERVQRLAKESPDLLNGKGASIAVNFSGCPRTLTRRGILARGWR